MRKKSKEVSIPEIKFEEGGPLNYQLKLHLLNLIRNGRLKKGDKLPTVYKLASQVGVSSATTRKVIGELKREGYLSSAPAVGTFVIANVDKQHKKISHPCGNIGILFPYMTQDLFNPEKSPWTWEILSSIQDALSNLGYFCTFFPIADSVNKAEEIVLNNSSNFSGFISFSDYSRGHFLDVLEKSKKPYMLIGKWRQDIKFNYVSCDNTDLGKKAAGHLLKTNCRSFYAVCYPPKVYYPSIRSVMAFQEELLRLGVDASHIKILEGLSPAEILDNITGIKPCGVFITSDKFALEILNICRQQGIKIPDRMRIISNAGTKMCNYSDPPLTAVRQPMREIGRESALTLVKLIENNIRYTKGIELPGELIVRKSTEEIQELTKTAVKS
jgi:GntR family transcriptional regulator, arabinose operon transcriptional repressor